MACLLTCYAAPSITLSSHRLQRISSVCLSVYRNPHSSFFVWDKKKRKETTTHHLISSHLISPSSAWKHHQFLANTRSFPPFAAVRCSCVPSFSFPPPAPAALPLALAEEARFSFPAAVSTRPPSSAFPPCHASPTDDILASICQVTVFAFHPEQVAPLPLTASRRSVGR